MNRKEFEMQATADYNELLSLVKNMSFENALKRLDGYNLEVDMYEKMRFDCNYKSIATTIFQTNMNKCEVHYVVEIYDNSGNVVESHYVVS